MTQTFEGVRIIELAQGAFVPSAGALLADHGAEVLKIEPPGFGDPGRNRHGTDRGRGSTNLSFEQNNRGKKSVAIDITSEDGRIALSRLVGTADVFLTSLQTEQLEALNVGSERLRACNPRLIFARGGGQGFGGAEADGAEGEASTFWVRGGFADLLTEPGAKTPIRSRPALGEHASAMSLLAGVASALFRREKTGEGMIVETSLLQNAAWILSSDLVNARASKGYDPIDSLHTEDHQSLMHAFKTADGRWIQVILPTSDRTWLELCRIVDLPALERDPRFMTLSLRRKNFAALSDLLCPCISKLTWQEWLPRLRGGAVAWRLAQTVHELAEDLDLQATGTIFPVKTTNNQFVEVVAGPISFNGHSSPSNPTGLSRLGQHSEEALFSAGYESEDLSYLRLTQVID